jgi:deoxyribonuclease V
VIVAVDVDYRDTEVIAAAIGFESWTADRTIIEVVVTSDAPPAPYEPGKFYLRELPHIRSALALLMPPLTAIIVDGFVWLGANPGLAANAGLGAHLYAALGETTPIIGVAKTQFAGAMAIEVIRGASARPLYVTAAGMDATEASEHVLAMHGEHRIPTLLKRVDQLARA